MSIAFLFTLFGVWQSLSCSLLPLMMCCTDEIWWTHRHTKGFSSIPIDYFSSSMIALSILIHTYKNCRVQKSLSTKSWRRNVSIMQHQSIKWSDFLPAVRTHKRHIFDIWSNEHWNRLSLRIKKKNHEEGKNTLQQISFVFDQYVKILHIIKKHNWKNTKLYLL